jgi:hypothetical protein
MTLPELVECVTVGYMATGFVPTCVIVEFLWKLRVKRELFFSKISRIIIE